MREISKLREWSGFAAYAVKKMADSVLFPLMRKIVSDETVESASQLLQRFLSPLVEEYIERKSIGVLDLLIRIKNEKGEKGEKVEFGNLNEVRSKIENMESDLKKSEMELRGSLEKKAGLERNFQDVKSKLEVIGKDLGLGDFKSKITAIDDLLKIEESLKEIKKVEMATANKKAIYEQTKSIRESYDNYMVCKTFKQILYDEGLRNQQGTAATALIVYTSGSKGGKEYFNEEKEKLIKDDKSGILHDCDAIDEFYKGLRNLIKRNQDQVDKLKSDFYKESKERIDAAVESIKKERIELLSSKDSGDASQSSQKETIESLSLEIPGVNPQLPKKEKIKTRKAQINADIFKENVVKNYSQSFKETANQRFAEGSEIFVMNNPNFPLPTLFTIDESLESRMDVNGQELKKKMIASSAMRKNFDGNGFVYCGYHPSKDGNNHHKIKFKDAGADLRFYGTGRIIKIDEENKEQIEGRLERDKDGVNLKVGEHVMLVTMNSQATHDQKRTNAALRS